MDEHILKNGYATNCTYNRIRETFLKEFYKNYVKFCELNYQYNSITGGSYVPLGRNRFNFYFKLLLKDYLNNNKVRLIMTRNGLVYRGLSLLTKLIETKQT
uniref:Uncharacterized protein n=1 Tax=Pseudoderbesia arbuscula TaxID=2320809 RepID=A0A386AYN8_9CHLO|nr:hypothetical protein [Pseudoderbesia arbuscula]